MKNKQVFNADLIVKVDKNNKKRLSIGGVAFLATVVAVATPISISQARHNVNLMSPMKSTTNIAYDKMVQDDRQVALQNLYAMPLASVDQIANYAIAWTNFMINYEGKTPSQATELANVYRNAFDKGSDSLLANAFENIILPAGFRLPENITTIPRYAFFNATLVGGIEIPNTVIDVGIYAFQNADLTAGLKLPDGVMHLWDYSFQGAKLSRDFRLPATIKSIGNATFAQVTLPEGFSLPDGLTELVRYAFFKASLPKGFKIPAGVTDLPENVFGQAVINSDFAIPISVAKIDDFAFDNAIIPAGYEWFLGSKQLAKPQPGAKLDMTKTAALNALKAMPLSTQADLELYLAAWKAFLEKYEGYTSAASLLVIQSYQKVFAANMENLPDRGFMGQVLPVGFRLPDVLRTIGDASFDLAILAGGITIPASVTSVGRGVFEYAKILQTFQFAPNTPIIWEGAFDHATLPDDFVLPPELKAIQKLAFSNVELPKGFEIPNGVTSIGQNAFYHATLNSGFTIPGSVNVLGDLAFESVILPNGHNWIANNKILPSGAIGSSVKPVTGQIIFNTFAFPDQVTALNNVSSTSFSLIPYSDKELGIVTPPLFGGVSLAEYWVFVNDVPGQLGVKAILNYDNLSVIKEFLVTGFKISHLNQ